MSSSARSAAMTSEVWTGGERIQTPIMASRPAEMSVSPSRLKSTSKIVPTCPFSARSFASLSTDHSATVASCDDVAICLPPGAMATPQIACACPSKTRSCAPVTASHITAVRSFDPVRQRLGTSFPSESRAVPEPKAQQRTYEVCPTSAVTTLSVATSKTKACLSSPPVTMRVQHSLQSTAAQQSVCASNVATTMPSRCTPSASSASPAHTSTMFARLSAEPKRMRGHSALSFAAATA